MTHMGFEPFTFDVEPANWQIENILDTALKYTTLSCLFLSVLFTLLL